MIKVSTTEKGLIEVRKDWPVFKVSTVATRVACSFDGRDSYLEATRVLGDAANVGPTTSTLVAVDSVRIGVTATDLTWRLGTATGVVD